MGFIERGCGEPLCSTKTGEPEGYLPSTPQCWCPRPRY
ncbi:hypothetical protein GECvBGOT_gp038 [Salmonella phage GEC_vB_GOT]|nr:hypothetical protein GECvBGOT_gp038 [Salmonella phage GEC_vB_GOT]